MFGAFMLFPTNEFSCSEVIVAQYPCAPYNVFSVIASSMFVMHESSAPSAQSVVAGSLTYS